MKKVLGVHNAPPAHWVGDGFPMRSLFNYSGPGGAGSGVEFEAASDASVLWLSGEPIDEPVVGHGPFVMNSQAEIAQAIDDFNSGRFGRMTA